MELIQFKQRQKIHAINPEKNATYCGKNPPAEAFMQQSGEIEDVTCQVCDALYDELIRGEQFERNVYEGMTYKEYQAHKKAQSMKSMPKKQYKHPFIIIEDENGNQVNCFVISEDRLKKLYEQE